MVLRSKFEQWLDSINGSRDNVEQVQDAVTNLSSAFFTDWYVDQLDRSGKAISPISLSIATQQVSVLLI